MEGVRIVFIAPEFNPADQTSLKMVDLGVYDIVISDTVGEILDRVKTPATFKDAQLLLSGSQQEKGINRKVSSELKKAMSINQVLTNPSGSASGLSNVITVWSPTPSGATMFSVNLAATLSESGCKVALLDFDKETLALHAWLNVPSEEDSLTEVLKTIKDKVQDVDLLSYFYQPKDVPGLWVLTADPLTSCPDIKEKIASQLIKGLSEDVDYVVIDTASQLPSPALNAAFGLSTAIYLMTDQDYHHIAILQRSLDALEKKFGLDKVSLVVNRYIETSMLGLNEIQAATGMQASYSVPDLSGTVFESVKGGVPAVLFDPVFKNVFREIADNL
jgi:MinD-like ATPase involved in chromosome partitioning or flagellar assembly